MPFPQPSPFGGSVSGTTLNLSPTVGVDGPRQYSPGYISMASSTPHHLDHSHGFNPLGREQNGADQDDWIQSPLHPNRMRSGGGGSASKSPYRGSGGGLFAFKDSGPLKSSRSSGLFGSTSKMSNSVKSKRISDAMEDDAPPKESLLDDDGHHSKPSRQDSYNHRSFASSLTNHPSDQASRSHSQNDHTPLAPSATGYKIHVFGFTPSQQAFVMNHFTSIGELVNPPELSPEGGNWATITYKHSTAAQRAVRKNGEILGGIIMIGCKWADGPPAASHEPSEQHTRPAADQRKFGAALGGLPRSSSMIVSRPLKMHASTEAFATPTQSGEKSLLGMISSAGKPNPSIFQDKNQDGSQEPAQNSIVNRALDLVFGW